MQTKIYSELKKIWYFFCCSCLSLVIYLIIKKIFNFYFIGLMIFMAIIFFIAAKVENYLIKFLEKKQQETV